MPHPIIAIVSVVSSERDRNGNCYHYGHVTNTANGESVAFMDLGGPSNLRHIVHGVLGGFEGTHTTEQSLPIRRWNRCKPEAGVYDGTEGKRAVAALFGKRMCEPCEGRGIVGHGPDAKHCEACKRKGYLKAKPTK